jgi:hypothetical protein
MTTHFSSGVTNVKGKGQGTSLFSGIKQPLITGATTPAEWTYQDDFVTYTAETWDEDKTGSAYVLAQYPQGWLRIGDANPAGGEKNGIASEPVFQYMSTKAWYFETKIAVTDVSDLNTWAGFAYDTYDDASALPADGIGFSHLEDTTTIQFVSRKNGAGVSFDMVDTSGGSTYTFADSSIATQSATVLAMPDNAVRLGFLFQPVGSAPGVTAVQYQLFLDGKSVGTQAATTVPDDLPMELNFHTESKGTTANDLYVDYAQTVQQR